MRWATTIIWFIASPLALCAVWARNVDSFPRMPEDFAIWLSNLYGARNGEELADLEDLSMFVVSFIVVAACTFLARLAWRRSRKSKVSTASER
jgi:hypothetical protein